MGGLITAKEDVKFWGGLAIGILGGFLGNLLSNAFFQWLDDMFNLWKFGNMMVLLIPFAYGLYFMIQQMYKS